MSIYPEISDNLQKGSNTINLQKAPEALPHDTVVMGNVTPVLFRTGTPDDIIAEVQRVYDECSAYDSFIISTDCDVPAASSRDNIKAYSEKVNEALCIR